MKDLAEDHPTFLKKIEKIKIISESFFAHMAHKKPFQEIVFLGQAKVNTWWMTRGLSFYMPIENDHYILIITNQKSKRSGERDDASQIAVGICGISEESESSTLQYETNNKLSLHPARLLLMWIGHPSVKSTPGTSQTHAPN